MNIIYFLKAFPVLSESFILNEVYELEQKGHNIAVCALDNPDEGVTHKEFNELGIPIHHIKKPVYSDITQLLSPKALHPRILKNTLYRAPIQIHAANLYRAKKCIEFVESLDWKPDHFHTHFASVSRYAASYVANYYEISFTVTAHAFDIYSKPVGAYTSTLLNSADRIVTISEYNKRYIQNRFESDTPIDIVRAGIRPEKFSPSEETVPKRILTVSRFTEKKGLKYALEAVATAAAQVPDIEYHIIGSGKQKETLLEKRNKLGIVDNVVFLDNVSDERLIAELDEARTFLLPCIISNSGDRDGIPVALMEAMAMKTPPVSTTVSGIPELIDHRQNGLLTEPRNPNATAEALVELLKDESMWAEYSEDARRKVSTEFNIKMEVNKLERTFRKAQTTN